MPGSSTAGRRYVALLRGINVGGHNKVSMAGLSHACAAIGCTDVATYIQSGNVVLASSLDASTLSRELATTVTERLGVSPAVVVRTADEMARVVDENPYPRADPATLHVAFLSSPLDGKTTTGLAEVDAAPQEAFEVRGAEIYLHLPDGLGRSKLPIALFERRRLPASATLRNWRTVVKLRDMVAAT